MAIILLFAYAFLAGHAFSGLVAQPPLLPRRPRLNGYFIIFKIILAVVCIDYYYTHYSSEARAEQLLVKIVHEWNDGRQNDAILELESAGDMVVDGKYNDHDTSDENDNR